MAWAESLGGISYPLLSDFYPHGLIAQKYGVMRPDGRSERAIFVIDMEGVIRYVDVHDIDEQPDNEELFRVLRTLAPAGAAGCPEDRGLPQFVEPEAEVILYCTPWCPDCIRVRRLFKENGVAFTEIDVSRNRPAAMHLRGYANGSETTPTFKIRGEVVVGYKRERVAQLLGLPYP